MPSTICNFHIEGATNDEEHSNKEVMDVLRVQRAIIDSLYNAKDINPPKPCKRAMRTCLTDLPPNDHKYRSINDAYYGSDTPCRSRGHRSKSQSPDLDIAKVTEGTHLLKNVSSTTNKTHEPSTRSALGIVTHAPILALRIHRM